MSSNSPKDPLIYAIKNIAKLDDSCLEELKSKTRIANIQDFSYLKFDDLKAALPDQPVFKLRMLETIAQYVASGEPILLTTNSTMIQQETSKKSQNEEEVVTPMKANPVYLEYCRGKSFILSKAVNPWSGDDHMALIQTAKEKIETKYGAIMGAGLTEDFLKLRGFVNGESLGAGQLVMNEELCLHHMDVLSDQKWLPVYKEYGMAVKYGVLIIAVTPEYFQS